MHVLIIQNFPSCTGGLLERYLREQRATVEVVASADLGRAEALAEHADLVVFLAAPMSVNDTTLPWIAQELAFIQRLLAAHRPTLGICFGAQMIARAAGGSVGPIGQRYEGWFENEVIGAPALRGPWFRWHEDRISLPPGAKVLATSESVVQAFQFGSAVGVQFHPEAEPGIVADWLGERQADLAARGVDAAALMAETEDMAEAAPGRAYPLFRYLIGLAAQAQSQ